MKARPTKRLAPTEEADPKTDPQEGAQLQGLKFIAAFKLVQGLLLALVGTGMLVLVSKSANGQLAHWLAVSELDTDNHFVHKLLSEVDTFSPLKFEKLSAGAFLYSVLLLFEGTGLLLRKIWAEYLTVLVTGSFLPWELFEVVRRFNLIALVIFIANGAIVWYLVRALKNKPPHLSS